MAKEEYDGSQGASDVTKMYQLWKQAIMRKDVASLEDIYAESFSWVNNVGTFRDKREDIFRITLDDTRYEQWNCEKMNVQISDNFASVLATESIKMFVFGLPVSTGRVIKADFERKGGRWQLAKIQETIKVA